MAVTERWEAEPTTGRKNEVGWLFDQPQSNYWLRVAASNLASQSLFLAGVARSHGNPQ